ncbi:GumC family protein [Polluticoccus soli]|uniref:GumC family protein n=1 Tax=Polluticoccus soli TaxID=3034150 RepID=UPI0023E0A608|nr:tyrosine-protein kinase [Flavipsychrobacter sp. JY13-12]
MQRDLQPIFEDSGRERGSTITIESVVEKVVEYWPLLLFFVGFSLIGAYLYLRYSTPVYFIQSKIYVRDNSKGGMGDGQMLQELGVHTGGSTVDNEIEIFKSRNLMKRVVDELDLNIRYLIKGRVKSTELYKRGPFIVTPLYNEHAIKTSYGYRVLLTGNKFSVCDGSLVHNGKYGDTIKLSVGAVILSKNLLAKPELDKDGEYFFAISPIEALAKEYANSLIIEPVNKLVSILRISINDAVPERGEDIVNTLIDVYIKANVDDRNRVVNGTIEFVDDRLSEVKRELAGVEKDIELFKSENHFTSIEDQSKMLVGNTNDNAKQLLQSEVKLKIVESLASYLKNEKNYNRVVPSSFFVEDITLNNLINTYNQIQGQKEALLLTNTEHSPYVQNIDQRLANSRNDILANLSSMRNTLKVSVNELEKNSSSYNARISQVPAKERIFLEYSRQQNIIEQLYLFLLKKREETAISKSATVASARVIDPAEAEDVPVAPNSQKIFLIAFALGLAIPSGYLFLRDLFNVKIRSKKDVAKLTSMSVIGEIGRNHSDAAVAIKRDSRTQLSEQFRALRTNLQFLLTNGEEKTILITSSMSGEGKSFIAMNLASSLALLNKKVVLLELDLRKPKISVHFGIDNRIGLSNYAIGKADLHDIVKPSGIFDGLYIIPSGAIPPNPAELIMLPRVQELIEDLKKEFDYIVLDTAPIGLVTDAQLLNRYADVSLYVVREGYTHRQQVQTSHELYGSGKMNRMSIVLNDVKITRGNGYGYGAYGNGYFDNGLETEPKQTRLKKIINKL